MHFQGKWSCIFQEKFLCMFQGKWPCNIQGKCIFQGKWPCISQERWLCIFQGKRSCIFQGKLLCISQGKLIIFSAIWRYGKFSSSKTYDIIKAEKNYENISAFKISSDEISNSIYVGMGLNINPRQFQRTIYWSFSDLFLDNSASRKYGLNVSYCIKNFVQFAF